MNMDVLFALMGLYNTIKNPPNKNEAKKTEPHPRARKSNRPIPRGYIERRPLPPRPIRGLNRMNHQQLPPPGEVRRRRFL
jgi:hypothetical protein